MWRQVRMNRKRRTCGKYCIFRESEEEESDLSLNIRKLRNEIENF